MSVCLQQRSSKSHVKLHVKSNATKMPRESTPYITLTLHFSQHDQEFFCLLQYFAWHWAGRLASWLSSLGLLVGNHGWRITLKIFWHVYPGSRTPLSWKFSIIHPQAPSSRWSALALLLLTNTPINRTFSESLIVLDYCLFLLKNQNIINIKRDLEMRSFLWK